MVNNVYEYSDLFIDYKGTEEKLTEDSIVIDKDLLEKRLKFLLNILLCMDASLKNAGYHGLKLLSCYRMPATDNAAILQKKKEGKIDKNAGVTLKDKTVTAHNVGAAFDVCLMPDDAKDANIPAILKYIVRYLEYHKITFDMIVDMSYCRWQSKTKGLFHIQFANANSEYRTKGKYITYEGTVKYVCNDIDAYFKQLNSIYSVEGTGKYDLLYTSVPAATQLPGLAGEMGTSGSTASGDTANTSATTTTTDTATDNQPTTSNDTEEVTTWKNEHNWTTILATDRNKAMTLISAENATDYITYLTATESSEPSLEEKSGVTSEQDVTYRLVNASYVDSSEHSAARELVNAYIEKFGTSDMSGGMNSTSDSGSSSSSSSSSSSDSSSSSSSSNSVLGSLTDQEFDDFNTSFGQKYATEYAAATAKAVAELKTKDWSSYQSYGYGYDVAIYDSGGSSVSWSGWSKISGGLSETSTKEITNTENEIMEAILKVYSKYNETLDTIYYNELAAYKKSLNKA